MKVLVTGATGFVASHLVPALATRHDVVALGHDAARIPTGDRITPLVLDLRDFDPTGLPAADAVVHLAQANVPFPDGAMDLLAVNTVATVRLLDHARRAGAARFVFASSASVYGFRDSPWSEDDVPQASDFYSSTKLAGERFVRSYAQFFGTTILRLVAPYGPGQQNRMIPRLIASVREGKPITLNLDAKPRMNPIFVEDVVHVVEQALARDDHHLVNVAGSDPASIRELGETIGAALGVEPRFEQGNGSAGDLVCDNRRMRETFAVEHVVSLAEGIRQTVA